MPTRCSHRPVTTTLSPALVGLQDFPMRSIQEHTEEPMRTLIILFLTFLSVGCSSRHAFDRYLDAAYQHYEADNCERVMQSLSQAERSSRPRSPVQPEISLLRGQCLERQSLVVDAGETYRFIIERYPASEYAYRARARLETLRQLGHYHAEAQLVVQPAKR